MLPSSAATACCASSSAPIRTGSLHDLDFPSLRAKRLVRFAQTIGTSSLSLLAMTVEVMTHHCRPSRLQAFQAWRADRPDGCRSRSILRTATV